MIEKYSLDTCSCVIINKLDEIGQIAKLIGKMAELWNLSAKLQQQINLVIEEVVSNIIFYAYTDEKKHEINLEFCKKEAGIFITISDDGKYFNLLESNIDVDIHAPIEERKVGGLGIHILKTLVDKVEYKRVGKLNVLEIIKYF